MLERGDLDGLRARVDAGDRDAAGRLAGQLIRRGRRESRDRAEMLLARLQEARDGEAADLA